MEADDPFVMLGRSHRRLEERLRELLAAAEELAGDGDPDEAMGTIDDVLGFFQRQVARHEADEEASLFPRLRARPELAPVLARLAEEHKGQARLWQELADALDAERPNQVLRAARALAESYRGHVRCEDEELFPAARAALGPADLAAIASEMEARRGRGGGGGGGGRGEGKNR